LVESFVSVIEVTTNTQANTTVTFFIKAIPEGALKIWSEPPPPKMPAIPPLLPACSKTIIISPAQTI